MSENTPLHPHIHIPLPSKRPSFAESDSQANVCAKIDAYFDDIIRNYSEPVKSRLQDMYYNNAHILPLDDWNHKGSALMQPFTQEQARTGICNHIQCEMLIDKRIFDRPVLSRIIKSHEIAAHAGQHYHEEEAIGFDAKLKKAHAGNNMKNFMEMSVIPSEKILVDALPMSIIENDIRGLNESIHLKEVKAYFENYKSSDFGDCLKLRHRNLEQVKSSEFAGFLERKDIQDFMANFNYSGKENSRSQKFAIAAITATALCGVIYGLHKIIHRHENDKTPDNAWVDKASNASDMQQTR